MKHTQVLSAFIMCCSFTGAFAQETVRTKLWVYKDHYQEGATQMYAMEKAKGEKFEFFSPGFEERSGPDRRAFQSIIGRTTYYTTQPERVKQLTPDKRLLIERAQYYLDLEANNRRADIEGLRQDNACLKNVMDNIADLLSSPSEKTNITKQVHAGGDTLSDSVNFTLYTSDRPSTAKGLCGTGQVILAATVIYGSSEPKYLGVAELVLSSQVVTQGQIGKLISNAVLNGFEQEYADTRYAHRLPELQQAAERDSFFIKIK